MDLRVTGDGSHTLFSDLAGQTYHSSFGAVTESRYIFIDAGLRYWLDNCSNGRSVRVLEVGFGTGLNVLLSALFAEEHNVKADFSTIDLYPLGADVYESLNYGSMLGADELFLSLHKSLWNGEYSSLSENFRLRKFNRDIVQFVDEFAHNPDCRNYFDVIYFDAFSPDSQPELWTQQVFDDLYAVAAENAVLTTYCSKGDVRRALIGAGFEVEKLAGPPGKRHILRAIKR